MKVLKFGGTSMANADSIKQVASIIRADKQNRFTVVSAPGKREKSDIKVTDLLYACYNEKLETGKCDKSLEVVKRRFDDIIDGLKINLDMSPYFADIRNNINTGASKDYVASRGEYLSAILTAGYLDLPFIDAAELIKFDMHGVFQSELTNEICAKKLKNFKNAVIPGFYGQMPNGEIKTFSRGGSDITGSIIARAAEAEVYENWTDVDGFLACDPRIVDNPVGISMLTYKELRELSYMGANVLHSDSIFPVRKCDIPINIRNTFNPSAQGTLIVPTKKYLSGEYKREERTVTGIAGKKDFVSIFMAKSMMNNELGFARRVLSVLERHNVSIEHMPSGVDTLSLIVDTASTDRDVLNRVVSDIKNECRPDSIEVMDNFALIAVVGHGMNRKKGTAAKVCGALSKADINIRMIDQGSSELNIIVAVENADYEKAIRALYDEFKGE